MLKPASNLVPELCTNGQFFIARDGTWYHENQPIRRLELVKLFSTILRRENDAYFLVTPVEKVPVRVECCPFVAVMTWRDDRGQIHIKTNVDDSIAVSAANTKLHRLTDNDASIPKVEIRDGLFALLSRPVYYQWVEWADVENDNGRCRFVLNTGDGQVVLGSVDESSL